jgi:cyclopropane fatty-acyl-phospholipid synthase-like methyltransferase
MERWLQTALGRFIRRGRLRRFGLRRWQQVNPRRRARHNVAHHDDLDGRLYSLFLDADQQYSCAYFESPDHRSTMPSSPRNATSPPSS